MLGQAERWQADSRRERRDCVVVWGAGWVGEGGGGRGGRGEGGENEVVGLGWREGRRLGRGCVEDGVEAVGGTPHLRGGMWGEDGGGEEMGLVPAGVELITLGWRAGR